MSWLKRMLPSVGAFSPATTDQPTQNDGEVNLWTACTKCSAPLYTSDLPKEFFVCKSCGKHLRISARQRLELFCDAEFEMRSIADHIKAVDWLNFKDREKYRNRIATAERDTGENEALIVMHAQVDGLELVVACFEFKFLGGSMSSAVGERFIKGVDYAVENNLPLVCFSTSGGARMQESMYSLLQMSRTAASIERLRRHSIPYISVLVDPVYGGVCASLAMLGDINIAEPDALIGFTGPRVMEQTLRVKLPEGFQRSEFLLQHGAVDMIVDRRDHKEVIARTLRRLQNNKDTSG